MRWFAPYVKDFRAETKPRRAACRRLSVSCRAARLGAGVLLALGTAVYLPGAAMPNGALEISTFFSTVYIDEKTTLPVVGDGDLWPSCWGDDNAIYTANGDGRGMDN